MNANGTSGIGETPFLTERTLQGLHGHLIARLPSLPRDAAILDVGCGTGAWLKRLSEDGFTNLWGIDRDLDGLGFAAATTAAADLDQDQLPFGDRKFDLITAIEVIEHLENPGRLYRLLSQYLKSTGVALVTTPNIHSLNSRMRHLLTGKMGQFDEKGDPTHIIPVLLDGVERILPRYGLKLVARWGYPEDGSSLLYRRPLRILSRALRLVLPDAIPGDALCFIVARA
jgi:SAM-dependent methyltransferase